MKVDIVWNDAEEVPVPMDADLVVQLRDGKYACARRFSMRAGDIIELWNAYGTYATMLADVVRWTALAPLLTASTLRRESLEDGEKPKAECPECKKMVCVTDEGLLYNHPAHWTRPPYCPGSGTRVNPSTATADEDENDRQFAEGLIQRVMVAKEEVQRRYGDYHICLENHCEEQPHPKFGRSYVPTGEITITVKRRRS